ncbi:MAG: hypothetical protein ACM3JD_20125 [Rudaea sp.]
MNRVFQNSLRVLIAAGSVFGFVGGWGLLAHSGKPVAPQAPAAQVAPLQQQQPGDFFQQSPSRLQPLQPSPFQVSPGFRLRTGGS